MDWGKRARDEMPIGACESEMDSVVEEEHCCSGAERGGGMASKSMGHRVALAVAGLGSGPSCRGVASDGSSRAGAAGVRAGTDPRFLFGGGAVVGACFCLCEAMGKRKRAFAL